MSTFLEALRERVPFFDGAFGTGVQARDLGPDDFGGPALEGCNEHLVLTRPDVIRDLHAGYFEVGVDAVETATFGSFPVVLTEYDIAEKTVEMNEVAARLAEEVAADFSTPDRPRWVIGSIGPGTKLPSLGHIGFADLRDAYVPQVEGLLHGGVDVLLIETVQDLLQGKAALVACRRAMASTGIDVPVMIQVTMETTGRMLVGSEIGAALTALEAMRPDVIGLNCATGPGEMTEHLRYLSQHARTFSRACPTPGCRRSSRAAPITTSRRRHWPTRTSALSRSSASTSSAAAVARRPSTCAKSWSVLVNARRLFASRSSSPAARRSTPTCRSTRSLRSSRSANAPTRTAREKFRDAMLDADWDACVQMAREQVKEGAHVLDVCVDYVGRDGVTDMDEIASRFATQASLPLVFDSTEPLVVEAGLQHSGGKAILNSANLEDGFAPGSRFDRVFSLAREYGAAVICLTIDEEGQARTAEWKLRVAKRIYELATEQYGMEPTDLIFDALTFPLGSGQEDLRRDGIETMDAIKAIKAELPGVSTILGLSNVSFGLKPALRHVINSVFLHECREAGLDAAIVHAARIMPMHKIEEHVREVALDLIYDRRRDEYDPLSVLLDLFSDIDASQLEQEDRSGWPVEERLKHRIIDGQRDGLEVDLEEQLQTLTRARDRQRRAARRHARRR